MAFWRRSERRSEERALSWWPSWGTNTNVPGGPTPAQALQVADVFACVRVLADSAASVPLIPYRRRESGRERLNSGRLAGLLEAPAPATTQANLVAQAMTHLSLWGNAYLGKFRHDQGEQASKAADWLEGMLADNGWHDSAGLKKLAAAQDITERTLELEQRGIPAVSFPQTDVRMIPASDRLYRAIVEKRLTLPDNDELRQHAAHAVAKHSRRGWRIERANRADNIDAIIALCMALDALEDQPAPVELLGWL